MTLGLSAIVIPIFCLVHEHGQNSECRHVLRYNTSSNVSDMLLFFENDIPTRHISRPFVGCVIVGRATVTPLQKNAKAGIQVSSAGSADEGRI